MNFKNTLVITPMFYAGKPPQTARWFMESAAYHGIEVTPIGVGEKWQGYFTSKVERVYAELKDATDYDYVLLVDGVDCLFATGLGEIHTKFEKLGHPFLISGEHFCWPWTKKYGDACPVPKNVPNRFRYPNSGGYMATWDAFTSRLEALIETEDNGYQEKGRGIKQCDQAAFFHLFMEQPGSIEVDYGCDIFQCLGGLDWRWVLNHDIEWGKRPFNHLTKTSPCVFHANGKEKWRLKTLWELFQR
ncbi:MAG: hypothetical protein GC159_17760 [Phycisphaera sp.]|nr:hypothetical protein [Phycisphaera sp.]